MSHGAIQKIKVASFFGTLCIVKCMMADRAQGMWQHICTEGFLN